MNNTLSLLIINTKHIKPEGLLISCRFLPPTTAFQQPLVPTERKQNSSLMKINQHYFSSLNLLHFKLQTGRNKKNHKEMSWGNKKKWNIFLCKAALTCPEQSPGFGCWWAWRRRCGRFWSEEEARRGGCNRQWAWGAAEHRKSVCEKY